ncbi:MAG: hypothetical protein WCA19_02015 [Candidatus Acidiferrales bacterium]
MSPVQITIDKEFESLIQPPTAQERELLTEQILRDGCREPLSVWKTEDDQRILLDGHNRYKICTEHRRGFQTVNIKLDSREQAKLWILLHQVGRRNLTDDQRAVIWNEIREQRSKVASIEAAAKARAAKASPVQVDSANLTETANKPVTPQVDTRKAVAIESKIPESKLRKVQQLKKVNPEIYEKIRTGKVSLREAKLPPTKPTKRDQRARYSDPDFFARIGRMLAGTLVHETLLDEILKMSKADWTPEAEYGFRCLIKNLDEVSERAHDYANGLNKLLRAYGKAKAA